MTRTTTKPVDTEHGNGAADYSGKTGRAAAWMFNPAAWAPSGNTGEAPFSGFKRLSTFNLELARFMANRARKNALLAASLTTCRTPHDAVETWREAAIEAVDDYASEVERLMDPQAH